jgi:hypothetical protein
MISRSSVSLIICTGGAYRPLRHDRHLSDASSFQIGVSRGRLIASKRMLALVAPMALHARIGWHPPKGGRSIAEVSMRLETRDDRSTELIVHPDRE